MQYTFLLYDMNIIKHDSMFFTETAMGNNELFICCYGVRGMYNLLNQNDQGNDSYQCKYYQFVPQEQKRTEA